MNEPERIIDKIFIKGTNAIALSCPKCSERTDTTIDAVQANNHFVCPHCGNVRIIDVEDLLEKRKAIMSAFLNKTQNN